MYIYIVGRSGLNVFAPTGHKPGKVLMSHEAVATALSGTNHPGTRRSEAALRPYEGSALSTARRFYVKAVIAPREDAPFCIGLWAGVL